MRISSVAMPTQAANSLAAQPHLHATWLQAFVQHMVTWIRDLLQLKRKNPEQPPDTACHMAGTEYAAEESRQH